MGKGNRYTEDFKNTIIELYESGMSLAELNSEYGIAKSTIKSWVNSNKKIKIDENEEISAKEVLALKKEIAKIKEENEILKKAMAIFAKK
ncbi:transposase [Anaerobranca californiensis DSM 14826]|jgi:transposase|uniref:Transposase n=2 Tax=Anaerobranca californiensis DSM 14826 TaxID=1120989 RepID=A0A1M6R368_9FIRM|nr:transposase [Anaerobranca californiensis DSM 14826]